MNDVLQIVACYWQAFALGAMFGVVVGLGLAMTKEYEL